MFISSVACFVATFLGGSLFGLISENVTIAVRSELYSKIINKHMGWFDDKDNSPGVISATMANDTNTLNGAASEGLATQLNACFALLVGIFLGFFFSW